MAIALVQEKGGYFYVYDEKGRQLFAKGKLASTLVGYTSNTVSIKKGGFIYVYDEKGHQIAAKSA
ncbi:hypothetical protein QTA56_06765 [Acinetobacter sp. VNH17]|uniref:WG repeat-containing protein n=1 Tax=Acinetobacter thutiue TaxID=2998078 RepID=A0ABT7WMN7_9GAMM|nr:hypothetical protein [Acinetobacter thutiue]MCY6411839.1 hypothetical protein [Acinetobacter thutiue]MDN0013941.1 hypothetical protein [Acinetobacter thutiue]